MVFSLVQKSVLIEFIFSHKLQCCARFEVYGKPIYICKYIFVTLGRRIHVSWFYFENHGKNTSIFNFVYTYSAHPTIGKFSIPNKIDRLYDVYLFPAILNQYNENYIHIVGYIVALFNIFAKMGCVKVFLYWKRKKKKKK
jgi:hypothetical protein